MNKEKLYAMMKEADFAFWENEPWKPEGATVDWASNYDKEVENLLGVFVEETVKAIIETAGNDHGQADRYIAAVLKRFVYDATV
jgi:hypothetical protein